MIIARYFIRRIKENISFIRSYIRIKRYGIDLKALDEFLDSFNEKK